LLPGNGARPYYVGTAVAGQVPPRPGQPGCRQISV